jgi:hypothetical protein
MNARGVAQIELPTEPALMSRHAFVTVAARLFRCSLAYL